MKTEEEDAHFSICSLAEGSVTCVSGTALLSSPLWGRLGLGSWPQFLLVL